MYLSLPSVYFGFFCLQVSSVSNFCFDTGGEGGHLFRLICLVVLWGGRNTANKYHWRVRGVLAVSWPQWVCSHSQGMCFPSLHCSGFRLLCREQALGCMHFSGSGSQVFHKSTDPTESAPLRSTRVPEPEWLRRGKCIQPRASLRQF